MPSRQRAAGCARAVVLGCILTRMTHTRILGKTLSSFLLIILLGPSLFAQKTVNFSGDWVIKLEGRVFMAVSLEAIPGGTAHYSGSLTRQRHFTTSGAASFSGITGPVVRLPIVGSTVKENCLLFTTQNPADANDKDDFQLCVLDDGRGTLKVDVPGLDPWPLSRENGPVAVATDWDRARSYFFDSGETSNPEMKKIFDEDQAVRQPSTGKIDWAVVGRTDLARREATRKLLADGNLHTGEDFERAAFVFQHGDSPDDYLLAHTLALAAVARGQSAAQWIAAATLDRYLTSIHQPQIYGTQFFTPQNAPVTQEPYSRSLISDALRRQLGVPSQGAQEEQRKQFEKARSTP
jgi:hypothetical protein